MGKKKHVSWDFFKDYHQGDDPGCIWIHPAEWKAPCHYAMNGYLESKGRTDMYNKDHRGEAVRLGYVSGWSQSNEPVAPTRRIRQGNRSPG